MSSEVPTDNIGVDRENPLRKDELHASKRSVSEHIVDSSSRNDGNGDEPEFDDEISDESSDLDIKLDHVSIMKIDTSQFETEIAVTEIDHIKHAKCIIEQIVGNKRKNNENLLGSPKKKLRLDRETAVNLIEKSDQQQPENSSDLSITTESRSNFLFSCNTSSAEIWQPNITNKPHDIIASDKNIESTDKTDSHILLNRKSSVALDTHSQKSVSASTPSLIAASDIGKQEDITSDYTQDICEVELKPQIKDRLKREGINYNLKLYLVEDKQDSSLSKSFATLVTETSRRRLCRETEVSKSYILLFYRHVQNTSGKSTVSSYSPEIFAITTGSAWRIVSKYADKDFTKKIEKRTLRFPFHEVTLKPVGGSISRNTKLARSGHEIIFTVWDFLGKLIGKRIRTLRQNSSLYENSLDAFLTKAGNHKKPKFHISETSMKIMCKLNIPQLGSVLGHFSKIYMNEKTYLVNKTEEKDDIRFEMHDFVIEVKDDDLLRKLNDRLHEVLKECMNGEKSQIFLSHPSLSKWTSAEDFSLLARLPSKQVDTDSATEKKKRHKIHTWYEYPRLDEVMEYLRDNCNKEYKEEWLTGAIIKFRTIEAPLKKCIFSRFNVEDIGTYIYHHGEWLEMKAQYLYHIERDFVEKMKAHLLEAGMLPLLPWKNPKERKKNGEEKKEKNKERHYKVKEFDLEKNKPKWKKHFETVCIRNQFDQVLKEGEDLSQGHSDLTFNFQSLRAKSVQEQAAHLYRLLECYLKEDDYNAAHTLLNMIRPDGSKPQIITCDKITPHGIEICDILIYDDKTTYLVHVKAGFKGEAIGNVCLQIRNAAEHIYRQQTMSKGTGIIDEYWNKLTTSAKKNEGANNPKSHKNEVKRHLESISKKKFKELFYSEREIVFVLACRQKSESEDDNNPKGESLTFGLETPHITDLGVNVTDEIRRQFPDPTKCGEIITKLTSEGYLTDHATLTNKFILGGKNTKKKFIKTVKTWCFIKPKKKADDLFDALVSGLSKSKSTVAKMEIIRLVQDFQKFSVDKAKFHLKIYDIDKDFPD